MVPNPKDCKKSEKTASLRSIGYHSYSTYQLLNTGLCNLINLNLIYVFVILMEYNKINSIKKIKYK